MLPAYLKKTAPILASGLALASLVACATSVVDNSPTKEEVFTTKGSVDGIRTFYDSSSRTVYVFDIGNISNPRIYTSTKYSLTGVCNRNVKMMNFIPESALNSSLKASLLAVARNQIGSVQGFASYENGESVRRPAVYAYSYGKWSAPFEREFHYNLVANVNGRNQSTGWLPDQYFGCKYSVPLN